MLKKKRNRLPHRRILPSLYLNQKSRVHCMNFIIVINLAPNWKDVNIHFIHYIQPVGKKSIHFAAAKFNHFAGISQHQFHVLKHDHNYLRITDSGKISQVWACLIFNGCQPYLRFLRMMIFSPDGWISQNKVSLTFRSFQI